MSLDVANSIKFILNGIILRTNTLLTYLRWFLKRAISLKKLTDAKSTNQPELLLTALHLLRCRIVEDIAISLS